MYKEIPYIKFLTREQINSVLIEETFEPLIDIPTTEKILHREGDGAKWLIPKLRKTVVDVLVKASTLLPDGYKFVVMSAFIPVSLQLQVWNRKHEKILTKNPTWTEEELDKETRKYAAYPIKGAPHNTGGAVDVIVLDENNRELDMGSLFGEVGKVSHTRYDQITNEQKNNRRLLYWTMVNAGFINTNPFEWWHYSYGDRAYSAYKGESVAIYGGLDD